MISGVIVQWLLLVCQCNHVEEGRADESCPVHVCEEQSGNLWPDSTLNLPQLNSCFQSLLPKAWRVTTVPWWRPSPSNWVTTTRSWSRSCRAAVAEKPPTSCLWQHPLRLRQSVPGHFLWETGPSLNYHTTPHLERSAIWMYIKVVLHAYYMT